MKTYQIIALVFLISFTTYGQNFKFGKVSKEELAEKVHPLDSSANAAILYKKENVRFDYRQGQGFVQIRSIHQRIKIYNKEGFNWATKKVKIYNGSSSGDEQLNGLKAYTYNLVDGKIEDDKLKKDGIFKEELNKYWNVETFTMPNINEGCIIEYKFEIESQFSQIDDIEIQSRIPVNRLEVSIKTPEYFIYNKMLNPMAAYIPKIVEAKASRNESLTNRSTSQTFTGVRKTTSSVSQLTMMENVININENSIPALKDEPFVNNLANYQAKLVLELTGTRFPNEAFNNLSTSWDVVTKTIYESNNFGDQLDKSGYYDDDLNALLEGVSNEVQKTNLIFNFVKSKVKWNNYFGITSDVGVRKAYKEGVGNVADMNLMLVSMLRSAGVQANPVLVSTKNNGIPLFPTRQGFDYVICMIESEGFNVLLDATENYSTFNVLPTRVLNWQGRIIRENGSSVWINLSPSVLSKDMTSLNVKINPDFSVQGKVRQQKTDYVAMSYRNQYADLSTDEFINSLQSENGELEVTDVNIKNKRDCTKPLVLSYDYNLGDAIEDIGGNLYFSPMLFFASEENPFKQKTRNFPIDLSYPFSDKYMINIQIPEGYEVESISENERVEFNNVADFTYLANVNGSFLQLTVSLNLKTSLILARDYELFKEFYTKVVEKQSEKIVLKKI